MVVVLKRDFQVVLPPEHYRRFLRAQDEGVGFFLVGTLDHAEGDLGMDGADTSTASLGCLVMFCTLKRLLPSSISMPTTSIWLFRILT